MGLCLALALASCAPTRPGEVAQRYLEALGGGQVGEAYGLTTLAFRDRVEASLFTALAGDGALRGEVSRVLQRGAEVRKVRMTMEGGVVMELVREGQRWRVQRGVVPRLDNSTPLATIRSFKNALRCHRWDLVLSLIPPPLRDRWTEARVAELFLEGQRLEEVMEGLEKVESLPCQIEANHAIWRSGRREVVLERIDGQWYVSDPV